MLHKEHKESVKAVKRFKRKERQEIIANGTKKIICPG
jgi:hypothetical protein